MIANTALEKAILSDMAVTSEDIRAIHQPATCLTIHNCTSDDWQNIGRTIATSLKLNALAIVNCAASNDFYKELVKSNTILRLRICPS